MAGEHIHRYLPSDLCDVRFLINGEVGEITQCQGHLGDIEPLRFMNGQCVSPIRRIPFQYQITAERVFEIGDNAQRIVSLLALTNGLVHHAKWNRHDSDVMLRVKKMIDTMLMSVEYVLKSEYQPDNTQDK